MEEIYDYIIIGAGVTGITLCKKLREKGVQKLLVLEKEDEPGGLCRTKRVEGHTLDIGGGHFFYTKHKEVEDYVFKHIPKGEFNIFERVSKVELDGITIDYPVESNIWQMPRDKEIEYLISIIRNGEVNNARQPENYEEWIRWRLGDKICDNYMIPYNEKLWGVSPKEMDIDWLYKIPRINVEEIINYCLDRKQDVNKFPAHIYFYYPKEGGFERIVKALAKDEMHYIKFGTRVNRLVRIDDLWLVNDKYMGKKVINTTPWNDLYEALGKPENLKNDFSKIRYNRIMVSLIERNYSVDWHWRYIPDINKAHHREFYIHNFAEDSKENGIYLETNIKRKEFAEENDKPIYESITDAAYPIPVMGHKKAIDNILGYYRELNLFGVGRWGQHEYQNADVSMHEAINFVNILL